MSQFQEVTKTLTIANTASARAWAAPCGMPVKNTTVWVSAKAVSADAVDFEVFFGGYFSAGTPFTQTATHAGGVSQGAAAAIGAASTDLAHLVFEDASLFPTNNPNSVTQFPLAYVCEFTNNTGAEITIYVTFIQETVGSNV